MISVVIPAHNEAAVIRRCLDSMLAGADPGELEIFVVCNGCSDETAAIARECGPDVRVIETQVASKSHALNLGDRAARGFPRFFVDADIVIDIASVRAVAAVLEEGKFLAAAPRLQIDLTGCSWGIRAYHEIWMQLPYVTDNMLGSGVYAVSERGRTRFDSFPDVIADDEIVRLAFADAEKTSVEEASFLVSLPTTLRSLIHINVRRLAGLIEMREREPETTSEDGQRQRRALLALFKQPALWPSLAVYVGVKLSTSLLYRWRERFGRHKDWTRDETSRTA